MNKLFKNYNYLSFFNPFVLNKKVGMKFSDEFENILNLSQKKIDLIAIAQILNFGYILGDRTLIKDIQKSPWMARPNDSNKGWSYYSVPDHQEKKIDCKLISETLFNKLKSEIKLYIADCNNIGFLLTGGMDSRIVASVLSTVLKEELYKNVKVFTYTWGDVKSRDVVYAKKISKLYNWNWTHLSIDDKQLENNIQFGIRNGCEFSPIHLHAMPKLNRFNKLDCILAGSFGDSIGRAEYSGNNVLNLKSLDSKFKNPLSILNKEIYKYSVIATNKDIEHYHTKFPQKKRYQQLEKDYQLHYMRRMLNPCFGIVNKKTPVFQMFSSPDVYGFMWSMHPDHRTDKIYYNILKNYSPELLEIPWARTGLPFLSSKGIPDNYNGKSIDYGLLIRTNFLNEIEEVLLKGSLVTHNIISSKKLNVLFKLLKHRPIKDSYYFEDKLIWLYSLQIFINKNNLTLKIYDRKFNSNIALYKSYYLRLLLYRHRKNIKELLKRISSYKK